MLTYRYFHVLFTLPPTVILALLYKPFWNPVDKWRMVFFCTVALLWTAPWDNWIVWRKAWWYCDGCVLFTVGLVPIEEYFFFLIQSVMTTLLTLLISRWQYPMLDLHAEGSDPNKSSSLLRSITAAGSLTLAIGGWVASRPTTKTFYMGAILWWSFIPLTLLLTGTLPYSLRRWRAYLAAIWIPTLYLWYADQYALKRGTWHINERTSLEIFTIDSLPIEEAVFFLVTNTLIVTGNFAIDKCLAIIKMYPEFIHPSPGHILDVNSNIPEQFISPSYIPGSFVSLSHLWKAYLIPEETLPYQRIKDVKGALAILTEASASFHTASWMFPWDLRLDMAILYGFFRATDDLVDNKDLSDKERYRAVELVRELINTIYSSSERVVARRNIEVFCKDKKLPECALEAACAFTLVSDVVPKENVLELVRGYEQDLAGKEIVDVGDLMDYSECVSGSVGAMCTHLLLARTCGDMTEEKKAEVLRSARDMGVSLQLTNIARDILTDATTLKRCYIPTTFFDKTTIHIKHSLLQGNIKHIPQATLRELALRILDLSDECYVRSVGGIAELPACCKGGVRAVCDVYRLIAAEIRKTPGYERRVYVSKMKRVWIGLVSLYRQD